MLPSPAVFRLCLVYLLPLQAASEPGRVLLPTLTGACASSVYRLLSIEHRHRHRNTHRLALNGDRLRIKLRCRLTKTFSIKRQQALI